MRDTINIRVSGKVGPFDEVTSSPAFEVDLTIGIPTRLVVGILNAFCHPGLDKERLEQIIADTIRKD
jgi:hypothetical protein